MNIVFLTTEAVPFAKTGGLADVCGTLPAKVSELGHQAVVIMPAFNSIRECGIPIKQTDISFAIPLSEKRLVGARLLKSKLPESDVAVWLIDQPQYFDRDGLYGDSAGDYRDNAERFTFFCRAALHAIQRIGWSVDIVHCNDWQTGLVPALLKASPESYPNVADAKSVMTIHNMAYQGSFPSEAFQWTGLDWSHFSPDSFEFFGRMNCLKTGIITADMVTTVSPRYAQEIRTAEQGCGLDGVLQARGDNVVGIINGIDSAVWDPSIDKNLVQRYDVESWQPGKQANRRALRTDFGLTQDDDVPLIGLVGRLAEQKGWDLILPVLRWHLTENRPTQWVVLGSGDASYENELRELSSQFPNRFALHVGFSDKLAHQIEAASDLFVMPSHYEPCGLNQLYSLRYGAVPVVTNTGGLANTVINADDKTLEDQSATGFMLREPTAESLDETIGRALRLRYHQPDQWHQVVTTGMKQDWSWRKSAIQYIRLYERTASLR